MQQQQRLGALGGDAAAQGASQRQQQLLPFASRYHVQHQQSPGHGQKLVHSHHHHKSHSSQYNHHRQLHQLHQHHLQGPANHYLHLQPSSQNLVHKQALLNHNHHHHLHLHNQHQHQHHHHHHHHHQHHHHEQQQQRLKQIASYAAQQVADTAGHQAEAPPDEAPTGSHCAIIEHTADAKVDHGELTVDQHHFRPRVHSTSQARPAGCSSAPFITRSMSFSAHNNQQRPSSADRNCLGHISGTQQHQMTLSTYGAGSLSPSGSTATSSGSGSGYRQSHSPYSTGSNGAGAGATISPSDALTLGINLEQYISKRNERERSRVRNVNEAFDNLKNSLPLNIERQAKRMSKVEILRTAIGYIRNLEKILGGQQQHFAAATTTTTTGNNNLLMMNGAGEGALVAADQSGMEQHQLTMLVGASSSPNTPTTSVSSITSTPATTPAHSPAHSGGLVSPTTATSVVSEYFGQLHGASNYLSNGENHFQQLKQQVAVGPPSERLHYQPELPNQQQPQQQQQQQQQLVSVPQEDSQFYYRDLKRHIEYDKYRGY